ncbi:hypothetical protein B0J11DRAFT_437381 [Dendryphion nanum]|uniref:Uncharacterized protein n=1 Tax=Dendryphion nanum TaxID=256645 RepID=A0A9P9IJN6_9PLEO|nr:hypothetical protein B0J11DRAFT_437381 [Dendryphion nanum]
MASTKSVREWLGSLELVNSVPVPGIDHAEHKNLISDNNSNKNKSPKTPKPKQPLLLALEDVSPTATDFSCQTIFDKPDILINYDDDSFSVSAATDYEFCDSYFDRTEKTQPQVPSGGKSFDDLEALSLNSYDPPSDADDLENDLRDGAEPTVTTNLQGNGKQLVRLVSCLQCTLGGLRCSRDLPACSRCVRNGCGNVCLALRRKTVHEMEQEGPRSDNIPVLLKLKRNEEDEWFRKEQLVHELLQNYSNKVDRENWVMPSWHGPGITSANSYNDLVALVHPGEGLGNVGQHSTCRWLELA